MSTSTIWDHGLVDKTLAQLHQHVNAAKQEGSREMPESLGFLEMPYGHALLLCPDRLYWHGIRFDGTESTYCRSPWAVYRWARDYWQRQRAPEGGG